MSQRGYIEGHGAQAAAQELSHQYKFWSCAATAQVASTWTRDTGVITGLMGRGHTAKFTSRPLKFTKDTHQYTDPVLGWCQVVMNNLKHLISSKDSNDPIQSKLHRDKLYQLAQTPPGLQHPVTNSTVRALKYIINLQTKQLVMLQHKVQALLHLATKLNKQQHKSSLQTWVNKALDPTQGYRVAHAFSRGCARAPPMPAVVHHNGSVLCNSVELAEHYLQQWTTLWQNQQAH